MKLIFSYGLFLLKMFIGILVIAILTLLFIRRKLLNRKKLPEGYLQLTHLGKKYHEIKNDMLLAISPKTGKGWKSIKDKLFSIFKHSDLKPNQDKPIIYVIDFKGSIDAKEVHYLREEISAILLVATNNDQVLLRLESAGGLVHSYGLAASQLQRLRNKGIFLTVIVDKMAASGGYMMACVANHLIAAPFAVVGSIGVVAQLPNFHRFLKRHEIDIELHTAGEYKRTLTLFGENHDRGRQKLIEELQATHQLFKKFIHDMRPTLDIDRVATGEHWFGTQAIKKNLIDEIGTSDDFILQKKDQCKLISVRYCISSKNQWFDSILNAIYQRIEYFLLKVISS
ncbi:MAG: protease SohB [Candidatus Dasytiphilus stammeri]